MFGSILSIASNLIGANKQKIANKQAFENQSSLDREFAQNGIQWRVEDAKKAGISPLAAMGMQGISPTASVGVPDIQSAFTNMGQDFRAAIDRTRSGGARVEARLNELQLERGELENALLRSQIAKINAAPTPPLPSNSGMSNILTGQGNSGYVTEVPAEAVHTQPNRAGQEAGMITDYGYARTPTGIIVVPSKDIKNRIEDNFWAESAWMLRNGLAPLFTGGHPKPDTKYFKPPEGYTDWKWSPWHGEYRPSR